MHIHNKSTRTNKTEPTNELKNKKMKAKVSTCNERGLSSTRKEGMRNDPVPEPQKGARTVQYEGPGRFFRS
jgi:hypothetical protein